jgi:hypothetical protein
MDLHCFGQSVVRLPPRSIAFSRVARFLRRLARHADSPLDSVVAATRSLASTSIRLARCMLRYLARVCTRIDTRHASIARHHCRDSSATVRLARFIARQSACDIRMRARFDGRPSDGRPSVTDTVLCCRSSCLCCSVVRALAFRRYDGVDTSRDAAHGWTNKRRRSAAADTHIIRTQWKEETKERGHGHCRGTNSANTTTDDDRCTTTAAADRTTTSRSQEKAAGQSG